MPQPLPWQSAFVATTVALGDTAADALASMSEHDGAAAASTVAALTSPRRDLRAKGLALAMAHLVAELDGARVE